MKVDGGVLQIDPKDNVAVALRVVGERETFGELMAVEGVPAGHKVALRTIESGEAVVKYGYPIGVAKREIRAGEHVHSHNLESALAGKLEARMFAAARGVERHDAAVRTFDGYRRTGGGVGIRNEIWIINTVGCVNRVATAIAERAARELVFEGSAVDGVHTFNHPYGCSQLGGDLAHTQALLAALAAHPNAAGVLVLGLGCENNQLKLFVEKLDRSCEERFRYCNAQDVADEIESGVGLVRELAEYAAQFKREPIPAAELVLGMKCGGSEGLSGITANPLVGRVADKLAAQGGTSILTEVPEMFGAEGVLLDRAVSADVSGEIAGLVNAFREYFAKHGEPIDENPSPGNKDGGITTLAEKSLGCVQKGGTYPVKQVLGYAERASAGLGGIALLNGPGNDGVSGTVLSAAGAHMVLFTTGRGTPMGFPVPTLKIATNSALAERKPGWIDFNAGVLADGSAEMDEVAEQLFELVLEVASGRVKTRSEVNGFREISIWKDGVTL
ncbi:MAG: altronate dehydratase family protein [Acidobacteriota bacterium]